MRKSLIFLTFFLLAIFIFVSCEKNPTESTVNVPELTTAEVTEITQRMAKCGGTITSNGGATVTACGVCWSTDQTPTVSDDKTTDGTGADSSFTSNITCLTPGKTYYVRAYATNSAGTGYGNAMPFTTEEAETGTVSDIDGNTYQTVKIGDQWWMAENLKVTHYRNGDPIPNVTDNTEWENLTSGAYCNYDNNANNATTYGRLYNWYAVNDSCNNIAPEGWHVPSDDEWKQLETYLGMSLLDADKTGWRGTNEGKLKECGTTHWESPNTGATNESGFSALPGGYRFGDYSFGDGTYFDMSGSATFWSSSPDTLSNGAWYRGLSYFYPKVYRHRLSKPYGFSVRCVSD